MKKTRMKTFVKYLAVLQVCLLLAGCADFSTGTELSQDGNSISQMVSDTTTQTTAETTTTTTTTVTTTTTATITTRTTTTTTRQTTAAPTSAVTTAPTVQTPAGEVVYKTPTGKRYHLDPDCGGKNSTPTTLDDAILLGLTPCKKCAS